MCRNNGDLIIPIAHHCDINTWTFSCNGIIPTPHYSDIPLFRHPIVQTISSNVIVPHYILFRKQLDLADFINFGGLIDI